MVSTAAGTPPNSPKKGQRPPSPGRGASHVVSAAAAAAVAAEWIENVRNNDVVSAARDAEKAASELAARLQQARQKKSEAAAEAEMLNESLKHSSMVKRVAVSGNGSSAGVAAAAGGVGKTMGFISMGRSKVCVAGLGLLGVGKGDSCSWVAAATKGYCHRRVCLRVW
jgi:hypothetical protein